MGWDRPDPEEFRATQILEEDVLARTIRSRNAAAIIVGLSAVVVSRQAFLWMKAE